MNVNTVSMEKSKPSENACCVSSTDQITITEVLSMTTDNLHSIDEVTHKILNCLRLENRHDIIEWHEYYDMFDHVNHNAELSKHVYETVIRIGIMLGCL